MCPNPSFERPTSESLKVVLQHFQSVPSPITPFRWLNYTYEQANQEQEDAERDGWLLRYSSRLALPEGGDGGRQPIPFIYSDGLAVYCGEWQASRRHGCGRLTLYSTPAAAKRAASAVTAYGAPANAASATASKSVTAAAAGAKIADIPPLLVGEAAFYDGGWVEGLPEGAGAMRDPVGGAYAGEPPQACIFIGSRKMR
jgi:hypothetical protein